MSSGLRNFIYNTMIFLVLWSGLMFVFAFVTYFLGNPIAPFMMVAFGGLGLLMFIELRWNPLYSTVAWVSSRLSHNP